MKDTHEQLISLFERMEQTYLEQTERQQEQTELNAYYRDMYI